MIDNLSGHNICVYYTCCLYCSFKKTLQILTKRIDQNNQRNASLSNNVFWNFENRKLPRQPTLNIYVTFSSFLLSCLSSSSYHHLPLLQLPFSLSSLPWIPPESTLPDLEEGPLWPCACCLWPNMQLKIQSCLWYSNPCLISNNKVRSK